MNSGDGNFLYAILVQTINLGNYFVYASAALFAPRYGDNALLAVYNQTPGFVELIRAFFFRHACVAKTIQACPNLERQLSPVPAPQ